MIRNAAIGGLVAAATLLGGGSATADVFAGYAADPGTVYFDGGATGAFVPTFGGTLFDDTTSAPLFANGTLEPDFSTGTLTIFDGVTPTFDSDSIVDYVLDFNIDVLGTDSLSVLWDLTGIGAVGTTDYGIMTYTADFGGANNETELATILTTTGFGGNGNLSVVGAAPIPLPASLVLLLSGLGALALGRRRRSA